VLTALSANSPYWEEEDTGYASYRTLVWSRWPSSGPTGLFHDPDGYDAAIADLLRTGAIVDEAMVYFDARLSAKYPTVEIRVADVCLEVADAVLLAALCRGLVETAAAGGRAARPRLELLRGAGWRAARSGLTGDLVDVSGGAPVPAWTLVRRLVDHIAPALERYGDLAAVEASLDRLRDRGTGADVQRAAFARRGRLSDVVTEAVRLTAGAPAPG
jgi:carboxylate-amine ligase